MLQIATEIRKKVVQLHIQDRHTLLLFLLLNMVYLKRQSQIGYMHTVKNAKQMMHI